jgi:hypothetical protein
VQIADSIGTGVAVQPVAVVRQLAVLSCSSPLVSTLSTITIVIALQPQHANTMMMANHRDSRNHGPDHLV